MKPVAVTWVEREPPLRPVAAAAVGDAARHLLMLLAQRPLEGLSGVVSHEPFAVVILAEADSLPWVDGVVYLGRDPIASGVLLPTTRRPDVPGDLFARAVLARVPMQGWPVAVLETPMLLLPVGSARRLGRAEIMRAAG